MLGGNLDDTRRIFEEALNKIVQNAGELINKSAIYVSDPWGEKDQPAFLNQAVIICTTLQPIELLNTVLTIENELGRVRESKNGPRKLDIDILLFNDLVVEEQDLQIPHPRMHLRRFNLVPVAEIAPKRVHPVLNKSISELLSICTDSLNVTIDE